MYRVFPWEPRLRSAPEAWLDWCLEMERRFPLGSLEFEKRADLAARTEFTRSNVGWATVLCGDALRRFKQRMMPSAAVLAKIKNPRRDFATPIKG